MNLFKANMGKIDRLIRVVVGLLLIANVFVLFQHPLGWLGAILVLTGIAGICPLYNLVRVDTRTAGEKIGLQ